MFFSEILFMCSFKLSGGRITVGPIWEGLWKAIMQREFCKGPRMECQYTRLMGLVCVLGSVRGPMRKASITIQRDGRLSTERIVSDGRHLKTDPFQIAGDDRGGNT